MINSKNESFKSGLSNMSNVLELRLKELNKSRQCLNNIKNLDEFLNLKLKLSQIFFDFDQEIRETIQNIKTIELSKREMGNEIEFLNQKLSNLEVKYSNSENYANELKQTNRELQHQLNLLQDKLSLSEICVNKIPGGKDINPILYENKIKGDEMQLNTKINDGIFLSPLNQITEKNFGEKNQKNFITLKMEKKKDNDKYNVEMNKKIKSREFNEISNNLLSYNSYNKKGQNNYDVNSIYPENLNNDDNDLKEDKIKSKNMSGYHNSELLQKNNYEKEKTNLKDMLSERENSKNLISNFLKENLGNIIDDRSDKLKEFKIEQKFENSKKEDSKLNKNIQEIKTNINVNNQIKHNPYDLPRLNRAANNGLNHFHEEKRKIEDSVLLLSEENFQNNNSISNLPINSTFQNEKYNINQKGFLNQNTEKQQINRNHFEADKRGNSERENQNNPKTRPDKIIQIILKIKSCNDTSVIVSQIFGEDILEKLISPETDVELLNEVEQIISEVEALKSKNAIENDELHKESNLFEESPQVKTNPQKYKINKEKYNENNEDPYNNRNNNNNVNVSDYSNSKSNHPNDEYFNNYKKINTTSSNRLIHSNSGAYINNSKNFNSNNLNDLTKYSNEINSENNVKISTNKSFLKNLSKNSSKINLEDFKDNTLNVKFEGMLRNYGNSQATGKLFKNYTKKGGDFFDPSLQKGGISALDYERRIRSRSRGRGLLNDSVGISQIDKSTDKIIREKVKNDSIINSSNINYKENYQYILGNKEYKFYND